MERYFRGLTACVLVAGMYAYSVSAQDYQSAMSKYDVGFYFLDLEVTNQSTFIRGSGTIKGTVDSEISGPFVFQLHRDLDIDSAFFKGQRVTFTRNGDYVSLVTGQALPANAPFDLQVYYNGVSGGSGFFSGISSGTDNKWKRRATWSLTEPFAALSLFPCKQVLTDKADSVWVFLTVDKPLLAGSNGILTKVVDLPGDRQRFEWKSRYPIAYYLISFTVGEYQDYSFYAALPGGNDSVLVQNYIYDHPEYLTENKELIDATAGMLALYSELFGDYPFREEKYGHCTAPMGGGMEHQTMTTLTDFRVFLGAHELAHSWFGNLVTCGSWQDIWINEGFASYGEYLAYEYLLSKELADTWMQNAHTWAMSEPSGSVYVPAAAAGNPSRIFSGALSYKKGAALVHMIRYLVNNDELFFQTLRDFLGLYAHSTATGEDMRTLLEAKTGTSFTSFFDDWYYGAGYPSYSAYWHQSPDSLFIEIQQTTSAPLVTSFFRIPLEIKLGRNGVQDTLIRMDVQAKNQQFRMGMEGTVKTVQIDPDNWLLNGVGEVQWVPDSYFSTGNLLKIWPNPAREKIELEWPETSGEKKLSLYSPQGKIVWKGSEQGRNATIDITGMSAGVYLLRVTSGAWTLEGKIIRQ